MGIQIPRPGPIHCSMRGPPLPTIVHDFAPYWHTPARTPSSPLALLRHTATPACFVLPLLALSRRTAAAASYARLDPLLLQPSSSQLNRLDKWCSSPASLLLCGRAGASPARLYSDTARPDLLTPLGGGERMEEEGGGCEQRWHQGEDEDRSRSHVEEDKDFLCLN